MEQTQNPMEIFQKEAPVVSEAFWKLVGSLESLKTLSPKLQQLVFIAIKAAQSDYTAVYMHIPLAKNFGASKEEIKDIIILTITICGIQAIINCLPQALDVYDKA
jgi:alkylhydroperoxidase/carboxymuconolactone decarboxylase family protein YurZ